MNLRVTILLFAAVLVGLAIAGARSRAQDGRHGHGHAERHDWYQQLKQPGTGISCCNGMTTKPDGTVTGDCRPTRARVTDAGTWEAMIDGRWTPIPPDVVLPAELNREAIYAHVCASLATKRIYCFLPAGSGG